MRNFIPVAVAIVLLQSCTYRGNDFCDRPRPSGGDRGPGREEKADTLPSEAKRDVYACVVKFPQSYDWRQDSLFGNVNCKLTLYRNAEPILDLKAGRDTGIPVSPGLHHIADGHLYTEGPGVVKRDGEDFYRFAGSERMVGILPGGPGVYTLSSISGGGFCLRQDGTQVLRMGSGIPKSLYKDGGHVYFSYLTGGPQDRSLNLVEDGVPRPVDFGPGERPLAVRMLEGKRYLLYIKDDHYFISDGRKEVRHCVCRPSEYEDAELFPFADGCGALVDKTFGTGKGSRILLTGSRGVAFISGGKASYVRMNPQCRWAEVVWEMDGTVTACCSDTTVFRIDRDAFLPADDCVWYGRGDLVLGMSDLSSGRPFLWDNGESLEIDAFGYISAVSVSLSR